MSEPTLNKPKFVIFAQPRTGSNALIARLNNKTDICCHYEMYHPKQVWLHEARVAAMGNINEKLKSCEYRDKHPFKFLKEHVDSASRYTFGFKIFRNHNPKVLETLAANRQWRKLILIRANLLDQFLSTEIALKTGAYIYAKEKKDLASSEKRIEFDFQRFLAFVQKERMIVNYYMSHCAGEVFFLEYNSAVLGSLTPIFDWLGLEDTEDDTESASLQKQNSSITANKVTNFDYLASSLSGSEFEWMISV